jgi:N-acyl-L-homoserine lactone synthetase
MFTVQTAASVLARCAPLRFGVARLAEELDAVFRLRYDVVVERGWARPEQFPDGRERDGYDDRAVQIAVWDGDVLAATTRMVLPMSGEALPTEAAFGLEIEPRGLVLDWGRTCVAPAYRQESHRVLGALLCCAWLEMRQRGYTTACGVFTPAITRLYRHMGMRIEVLAPSRMYWNERRHPVRVLPPVIVPDWMQRLLDQDASTPSSPDLLAA